MEIKAHKWGKYCTNLTATLDSIFTLNVDNARAYMEEGAMKLIGFSGSRLDLTWNEVKIFPNGKIEYFKDKLLVEESTECDMLMGAFVQGMLN